MPSKRRSLLDSFALIVFFKRERGFEKVKSLLQRARSSRAPLLMNEINIGEFYYSLARDWSLDQAESALRRLRTLPVEPVHNSYADVLEAARIKACFPLSYGDAFVVATAVRHNALVVTGDREFRAVEDLVKIDWL